LLFDQQRAIPRRVVDNFYTLSNGFLPKVEFLTCIARFQVVFGQILHLEQRLST